VGKGKGLEAEVEAVAAMETARWEREGSGAELCSAAEGLGNFGRDGWGGGLGRRRGGAGRRWIRW
jgi:hypothetical protein